MISLKRALQVYGTQGRLAEALGISTQAITQWKVIPLLQQYRLKYRIAPELFKRERVE